MVADYLRSQGLVFMVRPWSWRPGCPETTRPDIFEAVRIDENGAMRSAWVLDNGLRAYWNRYRASR